MKRGRDLRCFVSASVPLVKRWVLFVAALVLAFVAGWRVTCRLVLMERSGL